VKSNAIHIENITTKPVARKINLDNIARYQDMVVDALRDHGSGALSAYFFGRRRHPITARVKNALDSPRRNWRVCLSNISKQKNFVRMHDAAGQFSAHG
jgi:hypothetical protein